MSKDTPRIEGLPDPRKSSEIEKRSNVDPEKFKKILKVDESEESNKRNRRHRTKKEEDADEVDDEDKVDEGSNVPRDPDAFKSLLDPKKDTNSVLNPKKGTTPELEANPSPEENEPSTPYTLFTSQPGNDVDLDAEPGISVSVDEDDRGRVDLGSEPSAPAPSAPEEAPSPQASAETEQNRPTSPPPDTPENIPDSEGLSQAQKSTPTTHTSSDQQKQGKKKKEETRVIEETAPKTPAKTKKTKKETAVEIPLKTTKSPKPKKPASPKSAKEVHVATKEKAKKETDQEKEATKKGKKETEETVVVAPTPEKTVSKAPSHEKSEEKEEDDARAVALTKSPGNIQGEMDMDDGDTKDDKEKSHGGSNVVVEGLSSPLSMPIMEVPATNPPAYATLRSDTFELFEKMIGVMSIEQHSGISKTTITINMPGSVFHGCEVELDHYDTAPNMFNIQLLGNPQAVEYFNANIDDLVAAFRQSQLSFEVNIKKPILLGKNRHLIKRKAGANKDGGGTGGKPQR